VTVSREPNGDIYFECDGKRCAEIVECETDDFMEAREELKRARWRTRRNEINGQWEHYCPDHAGGR
jgi:hypothetical protein